MRAGRLDNEGGVGGTGAYPNPWLRHKAGNGLIHNGAARWANIQATQKVKMSFESCA